MHYVSPELYLLRRGFKNPRETGNRVRDVVYWEFGCVFLFGIDGRVQYGDNAMVMKINSEGVKPRGYNKDIEDLIW